MSQASACAGSGENASSLTLAPSACSYRARDATQHPIWENHRVNVFRQVLLAIAAPRPATDAPLAHAMAAISQTNAQRADASTSAAQACAADKCHGLPPQQQLDLLGELMLQSHASYTRVGLGSRGTDRLVALIRSRMRPFGGPKDDADSASAASIHGAKITGGGSGGTVCVLAQNSPEGDAAIRDVVQTYASETGHSPAVMSESSVGALLFNHRRVRLRQNSFGGATQQW